MRRERSRQTFKLLLLAFVLALTLIWYSFNPTPSLATCKRQVDESPEEKKRSVEPHSMPAALPIAFRPVGEAVGHLQSPNEDSCEWPEFIEG
jgi:hypothetical protein